MAAWLDADLFEQLERLESRHQQVQWEYRLAQRDLQRVGSCEAQHEAWQRYREVIAELDCATAAIETLRTSASEACRLAP